MAWTDPLQISINPLPTVLTDAFEESLIDLVKSGEISDIVFGLPTHADGQLTSVGKTVTKLKTRYEDKWPQISFHTIDESFTSKRARQLMVDMGTRKKQRQKKSNVDKMSAVIILKDHIDRI